MTAGIDGTRRGWVAVTWTGQSFSATAAGTLSHLLESMAGVRAIGLDMPIGFPDAATKGGRECEVLARRILGRRASSVFNSPSRIALGASSFEEAGEANRSSSIDRLGLSKQSFALFEKMREVDALMTVERQAQLFEAHPEVSFSLMAGHVSQPAPTAGKKTFSGVSQRIDLLERAGFLGVEGLLSQSKALSAAEDDILDACAVAWTSRRKALGTARRFPETPPADRRGLLMEIWA